jgi:hypothetical protein
MREFWNSGRWCHRSRSCRLKESKYTLMTEVRSAQQYSTDSASGELPKLRITLSYQELRPTKFRNPSTIYTSR